MSIQKIVGNIIKTVIIDKRFRITIAALIISTVALIGLVATVRADGATQISGIGYFAEPGECEDEVTGPNGQSPDFALNMTGDLQGCHYVFVETFDCTPSGIYIETGTELYVGSGSEGDNGTFRTTYQFEALYEDCPNLIGEIHGRCQHPIAAGTGTDDFEGVTGRLDFKDDIEAGNFPYKGHLKW
jgi:hypothetical protein